MTNIINKSNSDIINYKPDLEFKKKIETNLDLEGNKIEDNSLYYLTDIDNYTSQTLSDFIMYKPSSTIEELQNTVDNISLSIIELENKLSNTEYGTRYLSETNLIKKEQILFENSNDVNGSTVLEAYVQAKKLKKEVLNIKETYSNFVYGDIIEINEAKETDNEFIRQSKLLEQNLEDDTINYTSIYFDTMISSLISKYNYELTDSSIPYILNLDDDSETMPINDKYSNLMLKNFCKKRENLENDISKDEKTNYNIIVAINNTYLALQEYEDVLSATYDTDININNSRLSDELKSDSLSYLSKSLENLIKVLDYSVMTKEDIGNSLMDKSNIRKYFV